MDIVIALCVGVFLISLLTTISQLRSDIVKMNRKLDKITKHIGVVDITPENEDEEFKKLILEGKKIQAIKRYRMLTGEGLKEAKDYVDKIAEHIGLVDIKLENEDEEFKKLILKGKKIQAIKRYRMLTGVGLKEAKDYVDSISERNTR